MAYKVYREKNATFLTAKDTMSAASPITLFTIGIPDASATLYYSSYADGETITYFIPGTNVVQNYTPAPITVDPIKSNIEGTVDNLKISVSNVDRTITGYLHSYNGLRGCEVNILKVFKGSLADSTAYMRDIYYIDSAMVTQDAVEFTLTSKFNVQRVTLPMRTYYREQCSWNYNSSECVGTSAALGAAGCSRSLASCSAYGNIGRFGGFPTIPRIYYIR